MNEVNAGRPTKVEKRLRVKKMIKEELTMTKKNKGRREEGRQKNLRLQKGWGVYSCRGRTKNYGKKID